MTNEKMVADYSGIPQDIEYVAELFADEAEGDIQLLARDVVNTLREFYAALDDIGFELG